MAPTITTGLKPSSLIAFEVILPPSFIQQLHKVTFPIKLEQFCLFSALPVSNERPQQFWRRHYNTWAGQCQFPQQSLLRDHWPLCAHLGVEHLSASALTTLLEKIRASNRPMAKRGHHQECAWLAPEPVLTKGSGLGYVFRHDTVKSWLSFQVFLPSWPRD